ncbi:MAG: mechanosensitive ion channel, partial [Oscillospiraceae bacterium]|nr:mechanosensitive ion channel [Oscillospiraceae bacterium]
MEDYLSKLLFSVTEYGAKLVIAVVVFFVGKFLINKLTKRIEAGKAIQKIDGTARTAMVSFIRIALFVVLLVIVVSIMGIPMASIIALLASAGVTIGLALQGALSNLAGGIMILVFKPFKVDDYVEANGVQGVVTDITLFYTKMLTLDNKRITVPNGTLMNANVIDYTAEDIRR